ncbi:hypothetical protein GCM10007875_27070 [Limnobacter litoralis]|uniref:Uncharacterized protein n=2 Tax=Limnobacter litoralis TaxID=481366 RepID=A0ABQ5YUL1_9BURK|nr:hypothetical protein GCM10007875_27070 [Limnobacter litoralis]
MHVGAMAVFKLQEITLLEIDENTGLHTKEHRVFSFFEADRVISQIQQLVRQGAQRHLQFRIHYLENRHKRHYKGLFRFSQQSGAVSLQRHISDFLNQCETRLDQLRMSEADFRILKNRMTSLFEACTLEEMFRLNRKDIFVEP